MTMYEDHDKNPLWQKVGKKLEKLSVTASPALFKVTELVQAATDAVIFDQIAVELDIDSPAESVKVPIEHLVGGTLAASEVALTTFANIGGATLTYATITPFYFIQDAVFWGKTEVDDYPLSVLELEMNAMARNCAKIANTFVLGLYATETDMIIGSGSTISLGGSTLLMAIVDAKAAVEDAGYAPDTVILSPASYASLLKDVTFTSSLFSGEPGLKSPMNIMLNLKFVISGAVSDGKVYVQDSKKATYVAWRNRLAAEPVEVVGTYGCYMKGRLAAKIVTPGAIAVITIE